VCIPPVLQKATSIFQRTFPSHALHFGDETTIRNLSPPFRVNQPLTALADRKVKSQPSWETELDTHPETE